MRFHFESEQRLPYPLETVFAFFADPANLPRLMPRWQQARIERTEYQPPPPPPEPFPGAERILAGSGSRILLSARALPYLPVRLKWDALIEDFRWREGFCDRQVSGPFKYWRHCHSVRSDAAGTLLRDAVEYELPLGALGRLANALAVKRQIAGIFALRHRRTLELLAAKESV